MCKAGYYLSAASGCAVEIPCGAVEVYCPEGSGEPQAVTPGYYTTPEGNATESKREGEKKCEAGYYCISGRKQPCGSKDKYSGYGEETCRLVWIGQYSTGGSLDGSTRTGYLPCPLGTYCVAGIKRSAPRGKYMDKKSAASLDETKPCPGGTYGSALGLRNALCSGDCVEGYYCPPGSTNNKTKLCCTTDPITDQCTSLPGAFYCPRRSAAPISVTPGFYSTPVTSESVSTRTGQTKCPRGSYCKDGIKKGCGEGKPLPSRWFCPGPGMSEPTAMDPGFYGAVPVGLPENETLTQAKECEAGFFCANGRKDPCGGAAVYCPAKVSSPRTVFAGFYSTGVADCAASPAWCATIDIGPSNSFRTGQTRCPEGSYCKGGELFRCPPGSYGATPGMVSATCSGLCREGYVTCVVILPIVYQNTT